eukprot:1374943-Amorphochlora_amoeboformis.AAC.2
MQPIMQAIIVTEGHVSQCTTLPLPPWTGSTHRLRAFHIIPVTQGHVTQGLTQQSSFAGTYAARHLL